MCMRSARCRWMCMACMLHAMFDAHIVAREGSHSVHHSKLLWFVVALVVDAITVSMMWRICMVVVGTLHCAQSCVHTIWPHRWCLRPSHAALCNPPARRPRKLCGRARVGLLPHLPQLGHCAAQPRCLSFGGALDSNMNHVGSRCTSWVLPNVPLHREECRLRRPSTLMVVRKDRNSSPSLLQKYRQSTSCLAVAS